MRKRAKYIAKNPPMPLLDFFAAHALHGLLAGSKTWHLYDHGTKRDVSSFNDYAEAAYRLSEAMIEQRQLRLAAAESEVKEKT